MASRILLLLLVCPTTLAIMPTGAIDITIPGNPASSTIFASKASFGKQLAMGAGSNPTYTPIYPPPSDPLLCDQYDSNAQVSETRQIDEFSTSSESGGGTVMLIPRGNCTFESKTVAAQTLGASAVIIYGTLASRYSYNGTTNEIVYPVNQHDYDCDRGKAQVKGSDLLFLDGAYSSANDERLSGGSNLCAADPTGNFAGCPSQQCLLTGEVSQVGNDVLYTGCCAWDLNIWLYTDGSIETPVTIPALYVTTQHGDQILSLVQQNPGIQLTLYDRVRPEYNSSAILIWALGVLVCFLAAYISAGDLRGEMKRIQNGGLEYRALSVEEAPRRSSTAGQSGGQMGVEIPDVRLSQQQQPPPQQTREAPQMMQEESLELTAAHACVFLVMSSASLLILFYFKIYTFVKVMYGIGCSNALSQILFYPLIRNAGIRMGISTRTLDAPATVLCEETITYSMLAAGVTGYLVGIIWLIVGFTTSQSESIPFYWITQDIMGACICITFLGTIRLNSIRVASILLTVAFFYDIFFVFITPYFFDASVMITVATSGGPPTGDPLWCEKYPKSDGCTGGDPLPMLFTIPRLFDYQGGTSLLGLGDIVLPGLLLSFACRFDAAKRLVGLTSDNQSPSSTCHTKPRGYFIPVTVAYAVGLMMANIAVYVMEMGQPALLYLVPCCLGTMMVLANQRGETAELWKGPKVLIAAERIVNGYEGQYDGGVGASVEGEMGKRRSVGESTGMFA